MSDGNRVKAEQEIAETRDALIVELYRFNGCFEGRIGGPATVLHELVLSTRIEILDWVLGEGSDPSPPAAPVSLSERLSGYVQQKRDLFERLGVPSIEAWGAAREQHDGSE